MRFGSAAGGCLGGRGAETAGHEGAPWRAETVAVVEFAAVDGGFVEGIGVGGDADEESSEEGLSVGGGRGGGFAFGGADEEIGEDAEVFVGRREVGGLAFVPAEGGAGDGGVAGVDVESESEETASGFSGVGIS